MFRRRPVPGPLPVGHMRTFTADDRIPAKHADSRPEAARLRQLARRGANLNVKFQMMLAGTATATVTTGTAGCLAKPGRPGRPPRMQAPGRTLAGSGALAPSGPGPRMPVPGAAGGRAWTPLGTRPRAPTRTQTGSSVKTPIDSDPDPRCAQDGLQRRARPAPNFELEIRVGVWIPSRFHIGGVRAVPSGGLIAGWLWTGKRLEGDRQVLSFAQRDALPMVARYLANE